MSWAPTQSALLIRCTWSLVGWPSTNRTVVCVEGRWEGPAAVGETGPLGPCSGPTSKSHDAVLEAFRFEP